jgi:hypothetical protein
MIGRANMTFPIFFVLLKMKNFKIIIIIYCLIKNY